MQEVRAGLGVGAQVLRELRGTADRRVALERFRIEAVEARLLRSCTLATVGADADPGLIAERRRGGAVEDPLGPGGEAGG